MFSFPSSVASQHKLIKMHRHPSHLSFSFFVIIATIAISINLSNISVMRNFSFTHISFMCLLVVLVEMTEDILYLSQKMLVLRLFKIVVKTRSRVAIVTHATTSSFMLVNISYCLVFRYFSLCVVKALSHLCCYVSQGRLQPCKPSLLE